MFDTIKTKVIFKSNFFPVFAFEMDKNTHVFNLSKPLVCSIYVADEKIDEDFLFCQPLKTTSMAVDVFQILIDFLEIS